MTQAVAQILHEVEQLSPPERTELRRAIIESIPMSDDLTDDDFSALAAERFRALDAEEDAARAPMKMKFVPGSARGVGGV